MRKLFLLLIICVFAQQIKAQKKVLIYWDVSLSMQERDIEKEMIFLDNYFKKNPEVEVQLQMFSNEFVQKSSYSVKNSDSGALFWDLEQSIYDGSTTYSILFQENADEYLLFTDGNTVLDRLILPANVPVYVITSVISSDRQYLNELTRDSNKYFIYLQNLEFSDPNPKMDVVADVIAENVVKGRVMDANGSLPNAGIVNKNNNKNSATDAEGNYTISAEKGDILVFTYLGRKTATVKVADADTMNITMEIIGENLDEVIVNANVEKVELVNTGNGMVDKRRLGYDVQMITSDDISELDTDAQFAVKGQFAGLVMPMDTPHINFDLTEFRGRHLGMTINGNEHGLVVIDGVPQEVSISAFTDKGDVKTFRSAIGSYINPDNIASISYLKGLAATNKYGSLGMGGVLVITTKTATAVKSDVKKPIVLGTTSIYNGNVTVIKDLPNEEYISKLLESETIDAAFNTYLQLRNDQIDNPNFFVDAYQYFKSWDNPFLSKRILSNVLEIAPSSKNWLKTVAFKLQEDGDFEGSANIHEHLIEIAPNDAQSYRDLALSYVYADQMDKAHKIYRNIKEGLSVGKTDFSGINTTLDKDINNFILLSGRSSGLNPISTNAIKHKARIIFEWNNLDAEFEMNIINPQNRFFTWSNTQKDNSQKFEEQKRKGFALEEFFLTETDKGLWRFNLNYLGNGSNLPTYLKITVIDNFGHKSQKTKINVMRLDKTDTEIKVSEIMID